MSEQLYLWLGFLLFRLLLISFSVVLQNANLSETFIFLDLPVTSHDSHLSLLSSANCSLVLPPAFYCRSHFLAGIQWQPAPTRACNGVAQVEGCVPCVMATGTYVPSDPVCSVKNSRERFSCVPQFFCLPPCAPVTLVRRILLLLWRSSIRRHDFAVLWLSLRKLDPLPCCSKFPVSVDPKSPIVSTHQGDIVSGGGHNSTTFVELHPGLPDEFNWSLFNQCGISTSLKNNKVTYAHLVSICDELQLCISQHSRSRGDLIDMIARCYADALCCLTTSDVEMVNVYNKLATRGFGCFHSAVWPEILHTDLVYHNLHAMSVRLPPQLLAYVSQRFTHVAGYSEDYKFVCAMYVTEYLQTLRNGVAANDRDMHLCLLFDDFHKIVSLRTGDISSTTLTDKIKDVQTKWLRRESRNPIPRQLSNDNSSWPQPISDNTKQTCANNYMRSTNVQVPDPCACCSRARIGVEMRRINFTRAGCSVLDLGILSVPSSAPISVHQAFKNEHPVLNGLFLDKSGIVEGRRGQPALSMCIECYQSLTDGKIPRYSLRNGLYCGALPQEFADITWVEEMVCAVYRTTAHVTRLYQSDNPQNPYKMHGNTCAHETNVVSTADVLPRTPADILDRLSVVFVGPNKPTESQMKNVFRVRKTVVVNFLKWLKANNSLYAKIQISESSANQYHDNDKPFPGLMEQVIHDKETDPRKAFEEEAASLDKHPAQMFMDTVDLDPLADGDIFLSTSGVVDPEGSKISGRSSTSSALMNLALGTKDGSELEKPDLAIYRGTNAVPEYH